MKNNIQQNQHLVLGEMNTLKVNRHTPHGVFLTSLDEKDVLLPQIYVTEEMVDGSLVEVFLYTDSEDRLVATTIKPKAMLDQFALFEVVDIAPFGIFVDWGLPKDLLVPKMYLKESLKVGDKVFLKVIYDEKTHRLVGTPKIGEVFNKRVKGLKQYQKVDIVIMNKTPLGYKCLVEDKYQGLIYHNEIFEKIAIGDAKEAYIKSIRADGSIDLSLQVIGSKQKDVACEKIVSILKQNRGILPYNYKSDPELIYDVFGLSKKVYKSSLTKLQEDGIIEVKESGIYLK